MVWGETLARESADQNAIIVLIITLCVSVLLGAGCCFLALGIHATKIEGAAHASAGLGFQDPGRKSRAGPQLEWGFLPMHTWTKKAEGVMADWTLHYPHTSCYVGLKTDQLTARNND